MILDAFDWTTPANQTEIANHFANNTCYTMTHCGAAKDITDGKNVIWAFYTGTENASGAARSAVVRFLPNGDRSQLSDLTPLEELMIPEWCAC